MVKGGRIYTFVIEREFIPNLGWVFEFTVPAGVGMCIHEISITPEQHTATNFGAFAILQHTTTATGGTAGTIVPNHPTTVASTITVRKGIFSASPAGGTIMYRAGNENTTGFFYRPQEDCRFYTTGAANTFVALSVVRSFSIINMTTVVTYEEFGG